MTLWLYAAETACCGPFTYFSPDERQDVHLPGLALLDGGDDEAGAAEDDLPFGPAVDRQLEFPFPNIVSPRQLDTL